MAANDEDLAAALELHKQLNAIPLRARRGHGQELAHQLSIDRLKRDRGSAKPRSKRTNSSSQDHPSGKKQRTSDEHGHTSAHQRHIKRDPEDSNHSQQGGSEEQHEHKRRDGHSRDSGMAPGQELVLLQDLDPMQLLHEGSDPIHAASMYAAHKAKQQAVRQPGPPGQVKVFYAGVRWALSLPQSAVRSRQQLAKALNDAFVGEILSVGQGDSLSVIFIDSSGNAAELGPTKWSSSSRSALARWQTLAKTAVRIYVR